MQHPIDSKEDLVEAYLVGNRLCRFLSNVLPTHPDYWSSDRDVVANRTKSHSQLVELMYFVKQLAIMIDEDEHQEYISRVLDSSTGDNSSARAVASDYYGKSAPETDSVSGVINETSPETDSDSEVPDPSLGVPSESATEASSENFDSMWAKVATETTNGANDRKSPMHNKSLLDSTDTTLDDVVEEPDWAIFSDDMSWTKMSLSVSSSKFQAEGTPQKAEFQPPQVVKSKKKKKKSRPKPHLTPIVDVDESFDYGTRLEKRLRQAERNLKSLEMIEDDYPPPPESEYQIQRTSPPREGPLADSPTSALDSWSSTWDAPDTYGKARSTNRDVTKTSLITGHEKSLVHHDPERKNCMGLTRRNRALGGLRCVKFLIA